MRESKLSAVEALPLDAGVYLASCLAPLAELLSDKRVTDIYVNRPGEIWIEMLRGSIERKDEPALSEVTLVRLARQIAALTHEGVSREHPLRDATRWFSNPNRLPARHKRPDRDRRSTAGGALIDAREL
jgi:Flp pilus assembly CpaF family ATPase